MIKAAMMKYDWYRKGLEENEVENLMLQIYGAIDEGSGRPPVTPGDPP